MFCPKYSVRFIFFPIRETFLEQEGQYSRDNSIRKGFDLEKCLRKHKSFEHSKERVEDGWTQAEKLSAF